MRTIYRILLSLSLASAVPAAQAQQPAAPAHSRVVASGSEAAFSVLPGRWVRPDGGYVISIHAVDADGKLDAGYANPSPLPFHAARVTRDGSALRLFFELRAGGYDGSTYTLTYDGQSDRLEGVYYQAVAKQSFDVIFVREK